MRDINDQFPLGKSTNQRRAEKAGRIVIAVAVLLIICVLILVFYTV